MENNNNDEEVILNTQEESVELNTTYSSEEGAEQEESFDWKAEALKLKELSDNYKIRAEKAERKVKVAPETKQEVKSVNGRSTENLKDIYALVEAKVPEEDISEVEDYAKYKGISIAEALKTQAVRSILNEKSEMRNVASATNTGGSKRVGGRVSDETLLANAEKGNFPDSDAEIDRLVKLQFSKK